MKKVTRALKPEDAWQLLERPPRATLAFVRDGKIEAIPVAFRFEAGRHLIGVPAGAGPPPAQVKLLIDDGQWYFDLRGIWMRGSIAPCERPPGATSLDWYELTPVKSVAWHYGSMRVR